MLNSILEFINNNVSLITVGTNIGLIIVGGSALYIYKQQKKDEVRTAATLVKQQIDYIDDIVNELKKIVELNDVVIYNTSDILNYNLWNENKSILAKKLSITDFMLIDDLYNYNEQLHKAKKDIDESVKITWKQKSFFMQQTVINQFDSAKINNDEINNMVSININTNLLEFKLKMFSENQTKYTPILAIANFQNNLRSRPSLKGTTTYKKIEKLSYRQREI